MRFSLENLPPALRKQAERQIYGSPSPQESPETREKRPATPSAPLKRTTFPRKRANAPEPGKSADSVAPIPSTAASSPDDSVHDAFRKPSRIPSVQVSDLVETDFSFSNPPSTPPVANLRADQMSRTEIRFNRDVLLGNGLFEAITLRPPSGSRYTADFAVMDGDVPVLVEVKGSYRLDSEGRAHTAFMECAAAFSSIFRFVWARERKGRGKGWDLRLVVPKSSPSAPSPSAPSPSAPSPSSTGQPPQDDPDQPPLFPSDHTADASSSSKPLPKPAEQEA